MVIQEKLSLHADESRSGNTQEGERTREAIVRPLWNWTKRLDRESASASSDADGSGVRVLLISCDEEYRGHWQRIFDHRGWRLECVPALGQALSRLRASPVPVVVYDSPAADEDWRDVLIALRSVPQCPCILLTSSVIDESFGDEVVRLHGYDVFSRHADEDEIARTVNSALFWKRHHA